MGIDGAEIKQQNQLQQSNNRYIRYILVFLVIIAVGLISYFAGKTGNFKQGIIVEVDSDIQNEIDDQFGWGKASNDAEIQAVRIIKLTAVNTANKYTHPIPAIRLSLKNVGKNRVESFGLNYSFTNITNKSAIGTYAIASGGISPGWETEPLSLEISADDFYNAVTADTAFNFDVHAKVFLVKKTGEVVVLYETIFSPKDIASLQLL